MPRVQRGKVSATFEAREAAGCGSLRLLRALRGIRILQAAAPTAPPCFGRRPQSSPLQYQRKNIFIYSNAGMTAVIPALPFHEKGPNGEQPFAAVSLQLSRNRWNTNLPARFVA